MDDKLKKTLTCMIIGSSLYNLLLLILSTIFFLIYYKNTNNSFTLILKNELCLIIGYILSVIAIYSMALSITKVVNANDEAYAKKHMTISSVIRFIIFCIILIVIINKKVCGLSGGIMFLLSTLGIKIGAYLAPVIEKRVK